MSNALPESFKEMFKIATGLSIFLSILLIVFGLLAILLPVEMSFGVVVVISWLLMISGLVQFVHAFRCKDWRRSLWVIGALVGINMIMTGVTRLMLTIAIRRATPLTAQVAT